MSAPEPTRTSRRSSGAPGAAERMARATDSAAPSVALLVVETTSTRCSGHSAATCRPMVHVLPVPGGPQRMPQVRSVARASRGSPSAGTSAPAVRPAEAASAAARARRSPAKGSPV